MTTSSDFKNFLLVISTMINSVVLYGQNEELTLKVHFPTNRATITQSISDQIQSFVNNYNNNDAISIIGRADQKGSHSRNDELSYNRAKSVADYLVLQGFPKDKISLITGLGKRDPIDPNSPFTDSLNRAVWIVRVPSENSHIAVIQSEEIEYYSLEDSLIFVGPPYDSNLYTLDTPPLKGDTLRIDTSFVQMGGALHISRILHVVEGLIQDRSSTITNYNIQDTIIHIHLPISEDFLTQIDQPRKGDTLRIDTSFNQEGHTLTVLRQIFVAHDTTQFKLSLHAKELPKSKKKEDLTSAFLDTVMTSTLGQSIIIRDLTFEFGFHAMPRSNLPALNAILSAYDNLPHLKLEVRSHVCCREQDEDGYDKQSGQYDLSFNRAKEIHDFLIHKGVERSRIQYAGLGMSQPIVFPERDKNDQYLNRRIELVILDK